jgi:hypothetical protein
MHFRDTQVAASWNQICQRGGVLRADVASRSAAARQLVGVVALQLKETP